MTQAPGAAPDPAGPTDSAATLLRQLREHASPRSRYTEHGEVARGGMGVILKVWDADLRRALAMKVTHEQASDADGKLLVRFLEEAQITGQLDHPGIVPVHELGLDAQGRVYFTMRLVKGRDLSTIYELARRGEEGWSLARVLSVLLRACEALAYAHSKGVTHRDLKPSNLMVGRFGEVYVMDWGLARVAGRPDHRDLRIAGDPAASAAGPVSTLRRDGSEPQDSPLITADGDVIGTPAYMSPEQARGELHLIGPRSDVYALGAMLYELLAGHPPFLPPGHKRTAREVLEALKQRGPELLETAAPQAPAELVAICSKAMQRESVDRYEDIERLAEDLRAWLEGRVVRAYEQGPVAAATKWVRRNRALAATSAAVVLLSAGWLVSTALTAQADRDLLIDAVKTKDRALHEIESSRRAAELALLDVRREAYYGNLRLATLHLEAGRIEEAQERLAACPETLRGFEWHRLVLLLDPALYRLPVPGRLVGGVALSADGRVLVIEGENQTLEIHDVARGERLRLLSGHHATVQCVSVSADGSRVLSGSRDESARLWDGNNGAPLHVLLGHERAVRSVALSADGRIAATAADEDDVRLWDAATGEVLALLHSAESPLGSVALSADGQRAVTGAVNGGVRLWETATGQPLRDFTGLGTRAAAVSLSADGSVVAAGGLDGLLLAWDAESGALLATLPGVEAAITGLALSADGQRLASSSEDHRVRLWDLRTRATLATLPGHPTWSGPVSLSADGRRLAAASADDTVRVWCVEDGRSLASVGVSAREVLALSLSADGRRLLTGAADLHVRLADAGQGAELITLRAHEGWVTAVASSADGARFLSGSLDGTFKWWGPSGTPGAASSAAGPQDRPALIATRVAHGGVLCLALSADGQRAVSGGRDGQLKIWDAAQDAPRATLSGHGGSVLAAALSPDGSQVLSGGMDETARLWQADTGELRLMLGEHSSGHAGRVNAVAFTPDGKQLLTAAEDRSVRLWDATYGNTLRVLSGHRAAVNALAVSADGQRLASASEDGTVRVWELPSGEPLATLVGHEGGVTGLAFDGSGRRLVSVGRDGSLRVWESDRAAARRWWLGEPAPQN
ncbi:MAG: WD40 repeat domain-containing serine/threonine protein kinase [Planctomycetota bacterium]